MRNPNELCLYSGLVYMVLLKPILHLKGGM